MEVRIGKVTIGEEEIFCKSRREWCKACPLKGNLELDQGTLRCDGSQECYNGPLKSEVMTDAQFKQPLPTITFDSQA